MSSLIFDSSLAMKRFEVAESDRGLGVSGGHVLTAAGGSSKETFTTRQGEGDGDAFSWIREPFWLSLAIFQQGRGMGDLFDILSHIIQQSSLSILERGRRAESRLDTRGISFRLSGITFRVSNS